jgi:hypothetical protein
MVNVTITTNQISYTDSVLGDVSYNYNRETVEQVDAISIHIETDRGFKLYNVLQYTFNGQSFTNTTDFIGYLDSL